MLPVRLPHLHCRFPHVSPSIPTNLCAACGDPWAAMYIFVALGARQARTIVVPSVVHVAVPTVHDSQYFPLNKAAQPDASSLTERPSRVSCRATRRAEPLAEFMLFSGSDEPRSAWTYHK